MTRPPRPFCAWCGRVGGLRGVELDGRRLTFCEAWRERLRRALAGDPAFEFMLRALRRGVDR